jgi:DNA-binding CsgD family transcriptional regulator
VVVEAGDEVVAAARAALERQGWQVLATEWTGRPPTATPRPGRPPVVRLGVVATPADAAHAVLAALAGDGLLIAARAERDVIDRLCDDLRRLGPVDHRLGGEDTSPPALSDEQRELLRLLLAGHTLGQAAGLLHISRRTADRRLAGVRRSYGVTSTAEALLTARHDL